LVFRKEIEKLISVERMFETKVLMAVAVAVAKRLLIDAVDGEIDFERIDGLFYMQIEPHVYLHMLLCLKQSIFSNADRSKMDEFIS
jgi:hypothetical protein